MKNDPYELFQKSCAIQIEEISVGVKAATAEAVRKAADLILDCKGKLCMSGVGKSGQIAQKLAATFSSTGTPSFFMHPADAMHGDLGALRDGDVLFTLSKSGESNELVDLLRVVRKLKVPIISIVAVEGSRAAESSDVVILAPVSREADPLNLAPTASTTLALIVGDALAMSISEMRGFRREEFALSHPAGQLGKRLLMKAADFLIADRGTPIVSENAGIRELLEEETGPNLGGVMVVADDGQLIGLVTDGDIRRAIMEFGNILECNIPQIMTKNPIAIKGDTPAIDALRLMEERESPITVLPIIDADHHPVGLLRLHELIRAGL